MFSFFPVFLYFSLAFFCLHSCLRLVLSSFLWNFLCPLSLSLSVTFRLSLLPSQNSVLPAARLAAGQASDKLPHILLNCAEQWQGRHQYVAQEPGNPADVTIVLLVSNNNNNRKRKKRRRRRRTIIYQCKSGTHTSTVILTSLASL